MKRLFTLVSVSLLYLFLPLSVFAEEIKDFTTEITVASDSTMRVTEKILYDFGIDSRHGIYRSIPYTKTNSDNEVYQMNIQNFSVVNSANIPYTFTKTQDGENIKLKIGDPNKTITGIIPYWISYSVNGAFIPYSDHDELYWNIIGVSWEVPIRNVKAAVVLPVKPNNNDVQLACFTGALKSTDKNCSISYANGTISVQSLLPLSPGQGLTVVIGIPKNLISVVEATKINSSQSSLLSFIFSVCILLVSICWYVGIPIWIIIHWFRTGRDPKGAIGRAHVWFDVPKLKSGKVLTPGETGTLVDEVADLKDITATVVDLARRGYLKIIEKKKNDFYLEKTSPKNKTQTLESFEEKLYKGIFEDAESIRLKDGELSTIVASTKNNLYELVVKDGLFPKNPQTQRTIYYVLAGIALFTGNFLLAIVAFLFGRIMPRKTIDGVNAANVALALKGFISSQDRQYKFQAEKQLFFEKMLPYAIIFGVETIWAQRFKDLGVIQPTWYQTYNNNFTTLYFVNSLHNGLSSNVIRAATPTRSSSGFSSGFSSGGGFSGGGGGGGGGGSW